MTRSFSSKLCALDRVTFTSVSLERCEEGGTRLGYCRNAIVRTSLPHSCGAVPTAEANDLLERKRRRFCALPSSCTILTAYPSLVLASILVLASFTPHPLSFAGYHFFSFSFWYMRCAFPLIVKVGNVAIAYPSFGAMLATSISAFAWR